MPGSRLLLRSEAAELLRVSERTIRRYALAGRLDERRLSPHTVRVTEASVMALIGEADQHGEAA